MTRHWEIIRLMALIAVGWHALPSLGDAKPPIPTGNPPDRPNIIFVFIDDLGYGDLSIYGNPKIKTPHMDTLARDGIRFTQFYVNSPICSPSRVAVMTGQYPQRWHVHGHFAGRQRNRKRGMVDWLSTEAVTLPRLLKGAGYATAHYGKWHMGGQRDVGGAPHPKQYGFDDTLVSMEGLGARILEPGGDGLGNRNLGPPEDIRDVPKHDMTEVWVDHAIEFARTHRDQPFYINLWPRDVHDPFKPSEKELGRIDPVSDQPNPKQWRRFYAVLKELDRQLGRLVKAITDLDLAQETLILLTGDNGPTAWRHYYKAQKGDGGAPGFTGGLRGRKWSLYEGGIRQPLIVRWLGHTPSNEVNETTVMTGVDLLPSLCAIANVRLPQEYESDGVNLGKVLLGKSEPARARPIFWEYNALGGNIVPGLKKDQSPDLAIRDGDWKLLTDADGTGTELYNLAANPTESNNCAERYSRRTARMKSRVLHWFHRQMPPPQGNPAKPNVPQSILHR